MYKLIAWTDERCVVLGEFELLSDCTSCVDANKRNLVGAHFVTTDVYGNVYFYIGGSWNNINA